MKKIFTLFAALLVSGYVSASHNRAGDITYTRIPPYVQTVGGSTVAVYNYSIVVTRYTDSGINIADRCVDTVYFGDGSRGVASRQNGGTACSCGAPSLCGDIVVNQPSYVVKKSIYSVIHTYPGPGSYTIRSSDPNRNAGVVNISNSINQQHTLESLLVINNFGANTSPTFSNVPYDMATNVNCYYHTPGAMETEADSIAYSVVPCAGVFGFSYPSGGTNGYFFIDPVTGLLHWCGPQTVGEYNFGIKIEEWRKNPSTGNRQLIGYVIRDMQVIVKAGVVGLNESITDDMAIYPNPTSGHITIDNRNTKNISSVTIKDLSGKTIADFPGINNSATELDLGVLPAGVYLLEIKHASDNTLTRRKLIKVAE
jgi:hypothetical protein